ncbi:MAG: TIGR01777 family oxidoreductase, partial [Chloroflexi bacterium]|nr:TIGR01777 family oxidoreductase [Chloroflexota bacterium]
LAGRSVNCRYNAKNRQAIYASRLDSTRVLGEAIAQAANPPKLWINSSSATIYPDAYDRPMDEATGEIGSGFSVDVCQQWERTFFAAQTSHTRKVALRTAIVFGKGQGSPMEAYQMIVRLGLGGQQGSGKQFVSWVHLDDFIASIQWIIDHPELEGPINIAAPNPRTNADFMRILRLVSRQPLGLPATRWMLEIGAFFLRTETELLLKSRRAVPTRLLESGFQFRYPELYPALDNIVNG